LQFDLSTEDCKKFLKRHVNGKVKLAILYIDIHDSTKMSLLLSATNFALIVQVFSQEVGLAIGGYGGYVLKYVGDAVIAIFPSEFDSYKACENAINCARGILYLIKQCINPAFKIYGLPELTVKIGLDYGNALVVLYGKSLQKAHVDLISSSMGITAKITTVAQPNEIVIGQSIYNIFFPNDKLLKALSIPV
jgi:adenylate cyclase